MQTLLTYSKKTTIMRIAILAIVLFAAFMPANAQQPFRFDNKAYKAVYLNEAVQLMNSHPGYLLLDVRSPGEYADTSEATHMNMGRLKGAVNIDIDSFQQHLADLKKYSDKNIFVYCSHSQRSRRVSKILSDNGFTNVYNINGGMSVVNESSADIFPLKNKVFVNDNAYNNVASTDALNIIQQPGTLIIDLRSKEGFASKDAAPSNDIGYLKNAVNIPISEFPATFKTLNVPKGKTILLYDQYGYTSTDAAVQLAKMGYTHVNSLFEGLTAFMCDNHVTQAQINKVIINPPAFHVIGVRESINLLTQYKDFVVLDARPADQFDNKSSKEYLNVGRFKNAVSVATPDALDAAIKNVNKNARIFVYGSSGSNLDETTCKALVDKGFKNVYFLYQGIGRFAWASFNIENCKDGINFLTDHDGLY